MVELKEFHAEEVSKHNTKDSAWIIMHNNVYDVTNFLTEHPGGEEVILDVAGQDATEVFEDIGHSSDAKQMANDYIIGKLFLSEIPTKTPVPVAKEPTVKIEDDSWKSILLSPTWTNFLIPVGISIGVFLCYKAAQHVFMHL